MSFDSETNTIIFRDHSELTADTGSFYLKVLRDIASTPGVSKGVVEDWKIVESWLDCANRELNDNDYRKIGIAWRSYIARGAAPSVSLEPSFKKFAQLAKEENWKIEKVPSELFHVFDRMLATDKDIQQKRAFNALQFASFLRTLGEDDQKPASPHEVDSRGRRTLRSLSKGIRAAIALSVAWIAYVTYRTSGSYELVGVWLEQWDRDAFLPNILFPPVVVAGAVCLYKWITSAK